MKKVLYIFILPYLVFSSCGKDDKFWSGVYTLDFYSKSNSTGNFSKNSDPNGLRVEVISENAVRINDYLTVPLEGNRFKADIACCSIAFYAAYELVIDGTLTMKDGIACIEGYHYAVGQAGPFGGVFKMRKKGL